MLGRSVILITLFLGKPPGGSLPVLSAHYFASNRQLALLESTEEGNYFLRKIVPDARIDCGTAACEADTLPTELHLKKIIILLWPVPLIVYVSSLKVKQVQTSTSKNYLYLTVHFAW